MMGFLDRLPTLATRPKPNLAKSATPSRLEAKAAKDKADEQQLKIWRAEIFDRDEGRCRKCGLRVVRTLALHPRRSECHHLVGRDDQATRTDPRAGLLLCLRCHQQITGVVGGRVSIVPTAYFQKAGKKYPNADFPVTFTDSTAKG